ncbi:MAG TPA: iron ABC transporter permease [Dehalococcoidia bacterium]|nr:iron ABC transporter permease [Dehalococcoidia bacterium]
MTVKEAMTGDRPADAPAHWSMPSANVAAYPVAAALLILSILLGVIVGPAGIAPQDVVRVLLHHLLGADVGAPALADTIVWQIRLPRVIMAALVGCTLAYSGAAYQGVFRNPLADPFLLGVAAGAGLAATIVIVGPVPASWGPVSLITIASFGGALAAVFLTYGIARSGGRAPMTTLILAGVAVSSLATSATSYLLLAHQRDTIAILSWLLGGFNNSGWHQLWFIVPYTLPAAAVIFLHGRVLNVMQLDEHQAEQLGVNVERTRLVVLVAASLAAAAAVSVAGIVGFVGLIVPHLVRMAVGPDYRRLLPLSALLGASFMILADLGARTAISPGELPVGVVTACMGAPFFLYLLRRQRKAYF